MTSSDDEAERTSVVCPKDPLRKRGYVTVVYGITGSVL